MAALTAPLREADARTNTLQEMKVSADSCSLSRFKIIRVCSAWQQIRMHLLKDTDFVRVSKRATLRPTFSLVRVVDKKFLGVSEVSG